MFPLTVIIANSTIYYLKLPEDLEILQKYKTNFIKVTKTITNF